MSPDRFVLLVLSMFACLALAASPALAQGGSPDAAAPAPATTAEGGSGDGAAVEGALRSVEDPTVIDLAYKGGWLMIPIALFSLAVVAFTVERLLGLRRSKIIPEELVQSIEALNVERGGFDPPAVYRLCQRYPSPLANVLKATVQKLGRPHAEVEQVADESIDREAYNMFANVRPLTLAVTLAPLLGLLGTVWGMIDAFIVTAQAPSDKAELLASGIYTALVTTFGGLTVAIPAALFAHFFEGRIERLAREIEHVIALLLPEMESFEGKQRFRRVRRHRHEAGREPIGAPRTAEPVESEVDERTPVHGEPAHATQTAESLSVRGASFGVGPSAILWREQQSERRE